MSRRTTWRFGIRLAVLAAFLLLYPLFEWSPLQHVVRAATVSILRVFGVGSLSIDGPSELYLVLGTDGRIFRIGANCTYADLTLYLAPFVWLFGGFTVNALRMVTLAVTVLTLNIVRLVVAIQLSGAGVSWYRAHDLPDDLIHTSLVTAAALLALRRDRYGSPASVG